MRQSRSSARSRHRRKRRSGQYVMPGNPKGVIAFGGILIIAILYVGRYVLGLDLFFGRFSAIMVLAVISALLGAAASTPRFEKRWLGMVAIMVGVAVIVFEIQVAPRI